MIYCIRFAATFVSSHVIALVRTGEIPEKAGGRTVALPAMGSEQFAKTCDSFIAANSTNDHHER